MAHRKGDLSALIVHIAAGQSLAASARAAGVSVSTAQRRLRDPKVQAEIAEAYADHSRQTSGRFRDIRSQALDGLSQLLASDPEPQVQLRAIEIALRHASAADNGWVQEMLSMQIAAMAEARSDLRRLQGE